MRCSSFNERARWCLDLSPLSARYTEDTHPPGLCQFAVQEATAGVTSGSPLLLMADGEMYADSSAVLRGLHERYPDELQWLYPPGCAKEVLDLEEQIVSSLGSSSRQLAFSYALDPEHYALTERYLTRGSSCMEHLLFRCGAGKLITAAIVELYNCRMSSVPKARAALVSLFESLSRRLVPGWPLIQKLPFGLSSRTYLVGGSFSAADLTFAALAWPVILPPEVSDS